MNVIHWTENSHYFLKFLVEAQQKIGINSINTSLSDLNQIGNVDIVHIHWPEDCLSGYKRSSDFLGTLDELKSMGIKVVMTLHNEKPHIGNGEKLYNEVLMRLDGLIHLGSYSYNIFEERYSYKQAVIPLGLFEYDNTVNRKESRLKLSISDDVKVVLVFGTIRKFSEFKTILKVFLRIRQKKTRISFLLSNTRNMQLPSIKRDIIGRIESIFLIAFAKLSPSIIMYDKPILDHEVQHFFNASDTVLLIRNSLNSGIPYVAEFFNKPIIGPDTGNIQECIKDFNGYLYETADPKTISKLIVASLENKREQKVNSTHFKYSWTTSAKKHVSFYKEVLKPFRRNFGNHLS